VSRRYSYIHLGRRLAGGLVSLAAWLVLLLAAPAPALAGPPGMPDPRQMSGIPRPDPQIPAGEVTVRALLGGFDEPALGAKVELELRSADGRVAELRSAEAGNQGRAHFRELGAFAGGQAVARVTLDGETIRSQQIDLLADSGTAVMLVQGAPKSSTPEISLPGIVFGFDNVKPGGVMVGVFDLGKRTGLPKLPVHLDITTADGQTETRTVESGNEGQAAFQGLEQLPTGATLQVRAQLDPEGEPYRSMKFQVDPAQGQAVVLARGRMARAGGNPHESGGQGGAPTAGKRKAMPGPRVAPELAVGGVQVLVVDSNDQPLPGHPITIVKKDFSGTEERFELQTNADGMAEQLDLPVVNDALYYVGVVYDGAPYTSAFFGLDQRGGVRVAMRVWQVTSDPAVAQSAVQWELIEAENDHAQVVQIYEVLVTGDEAYWPEEELRIGGIEGAKSMVVLRGAEEWLDHDDEKAPFGTLAHPIPPGEVAALSIGYVIEHDGEIEIDWTPPFQVVESAIVVKESFEVDAPGAKRSTRPVPAQQGLDYERVAYELGQKGTGTQRVTVTGLRRTDRRFAWVGMGIGAVLSVVLGLGLALRPGGDTRARLIRRRDQLLTALEQRRSEAERRRVVAALDRIYRQLDALAALETKTKVSPAAPEPGATAG
jgi:hypothetical protein